MASNILDGIFSDTYQRGKVIDPRTGRPWQEEDGYDSNFALPHVITFSSIFQTHFKTFLQSGHDEALRNDPDFARCMRRDPFIMGLMQERAMATTSLRWHIEVENEKDPEEKAIKDALTMVIKATPHLQKMVKYLLEGIFYGRYGAQLAYQKRDMILPDPLRNGERTRQRVPVIADHIPTNGDKIAFQFDGTPGVLLHAAEASRVPNSSIIYTSKGKALSLRGSYRSRWIIHKHELIDADFYEPEAAGSVHGVGLRSTLYWMAWLRKEWLGMISDWVERTGLGVRLWYYQGGNKKSREEVEAAAKRATDRTNILVPRFTNQAGRPSEGVEFADTSGTGAGVLQSLLTHIEEIMERYVIGQTLSSGTEGNGLGGTGVADLHAATKGKIVAFDANNLAETLTNDLVRPLKFWMFPHHQDVPARWVFDLDRPNTNETINAVVSLAGLGVDFVKDEVRGLAPGMSAPQEGDETVGGQQMLGQPGQPEPGADPGGEPTHEDFASIMEGMGDGEQPEAFRRRGVVERYAFDEPVKQPKQTKPEPLPKAPQNALPMSEPEPAEPPATSLDKEKPKSEKKTEAKPGAPAPHVHARAAKYADKLMDANGGDSAKAVAHLHKKLAEYGPKAMAGDEDAKRKLAAAHAMLSHITPKAPPQPEPTIADMKDQGKGPKPRLSSRRSNDPMFERPPAFDDVAERGARWKEKDEHRRNEDVAKPPVPKQEGETEVQEWVPLKSLMNKVTDRPIRGEHDHLGNIGEALARAINTATFGIGPYKPKFEYPTLGEEAKSRLFSGEPKLFDTLKKNNISVNLRDAGGKTEYGDSDTIRTTVEVKDHANRKAWEIDLPNDRYEALQQLAKDVRAGKEVGDESKVTADDMLVRQVPYDRAKGEPKPENQYQPAKAASQQREPSPTDWDIPGDVAPMLQPRKQDALGFYNNIEDAMRTFQNKGTPQQLMAHLQKHAGAMQQADVIGLKSWLEGKQSVTKQEVMDFLAGNHPELEEVSQANDSKWTVNDQLGKPVTNQFFASKKDADKYRDQLISEETQKAWQKYGSDQPLEEHEAQKKELYDDIAKEFTSEQVNDEDSTGGTKYHEWQLPGPSDGYDELHVTAPGAKQPAFQIISPDGKRLPGIYRHKSSAEQRIKESGWEGKATIENVPSPTRWQDGHDDYDHVQNPVVRVRHNTRTDADGKKMLFIEEMQGPQDEQQKNMPQWLRDRIYDIGLKRMLRKAADEGYDRIGWTTGQQQADRYNLEKHVDKISMRPVSKDASGGKDEVILYGEKGGQKVVDKIVQRSELSSYVGSDVATKLMEHGEVSGEDLRIGGEGLKNLYDKVLPNKAAKLLKRAGGKVGQAGIYANNGSYDVDDILSEKDDELVAKNKELSLVHSIDITPEVRKLLQEGQPLFNLGDKEKAAGGYQTATGQPFQPQDVTADFAKNAAKLSRHHGQMSNAIVGGLKNSGLDQAKVKEYASHAYAVLERLPEGAVAQINQHMTGGATFHPDMGSIGQAMAKESPKVKKYVESGYTIAGAVHFGKDGKVSVHLDGSGSQHGQQIYAHEFGHLIDGPDRIHSDSATWQVIWRNEIAGQQIGKYAASDHREGFAEFCRLVYAEHASPEELKAKFPTATAYFQRHGLLARGTKPITGLPQIFDEAVNDNGVHADMIKPGGDRVDLMPDDSAISIKSEDVLPTSATSPYEVKSGDQPTVKKPTQIIGQNRQRTPVYPDPGEQWWHTNRDAPRLAKAEPVSYANLKAKNVNAVHLVTFDDDPNEQGIWKPAAGETSELRRTVLGNYYGRETAAWEVAELLGIGHLVPPTVTREARNGIGSMQKYVPGTKPAFNASVPYDGPEDFGRSAAFDFLIGNTDRHQGNWLVKNNRLVLIDHGLCFPATNDRDEGLNADIFQEAVKRKAMVPPEAIKWMERSEDVVRSLRRNGMNDDEIRATMSRARLLSTAAEEGMSFSDMFRYGELQLFRWNLMNYAGWSER